MIASVKDLERTDKLDQKPAISLESSIEDSRGKESSVNHSFAWLLIRILIFIVTFVLIFFSQIRVASSESSPTKDDQAVQNNVNPEGKTPKKETDPATKSGDKAAQELKDGLQGLEPEASQVPPARPPGGPQILGQAEKKVEAQVDPLVDTLPIPGKELPGSHRDLKYLSLAWRFQLLIHEVLGREHTESELTRKNRFFTSVFNWALGASSRSGVSDNPRQVAHAVAEELFQSQKLKIISEEEHIYTLHPAAVMERKEANSLCAGLLFLAVAEVVRPEIPFYFVPMAEGGIIRYEHEAYSVNILLHSNFEGEAWGTERLIEHFSELQLIKSSKNTLPGVDTEGLEGLLNQSLAESLLKENKVTEAREALVRSVEFLPSLHSASLELARLAVEGGEYQQALEWVQKTLKIKPDHFEALELQASIQIQRGKTHVGKKLIENLLKKSPAQKKRLHVLLGDIARSEGDWEGALGHYRHAASGAKSAEELERLTQRARELQQQRQIDILGSDEASYPEKFTAVRELSKTDEPKVIEAMVSLLDDPNLRLARFAWKALQGITGENIGFSKVKWQAWIDAND